MSAMCASIYLNIRITKMLYKNALLTSFLNRFWQIKARWKGLELSFPYLLPDITFGKALHVIPYKNKPMSRKIANISRNITIMIWLYTLFESVMTM